jgi:hypothetical protein
MTLMTLMPLPVIVVRHYTNAAGQERNSPANRLLIPPAAHKSLQALTKVRTPCLPAFKGAPLFAACTASFAFVV